jgi:hypothetical protein
VRLLSIRNPLRAAFTATSLAALFIVSGLAGYTPSRHARFVAGTAWSDSVIWWEVAVGMALLPLAAYFWRRAIRDDGRRRT